MKKKVYGSKRRNRKSDSCTRIDGGLAPCLGAVDTSIASIERMEYKTR